MGRRGGGMEVVNPWLTNIRGEMTTVVDIVYSKMTDIAHSKSTKTKLERYVWWSNQTTARTLYFYWL